MTLQGEGPDLVDDGAPDHFHISEPHLAPVGHGDTDHAGFAAALRRTGYTGWCSVEMRKPEGSSRLEELRRAMRFAVQTYGE
jgi:sugar phosphate isomerase/epimerase